MLVSLVTLALLGIAQAAQPQQETAFSCQTAFMTSTIVEGTPIPILLAGRDGPLKLPKKLGTCKTTTPTYMTL
jgi:hypothetical protein